MERAVPWDPLCDIVRPYCTNVRVGRKRKPLSRMLKVLCLQQWYSPSDPGAEEEIYDRSFFREFPGIDLHDCSVPDETTIPEFRRLLERRGLFEKIFGRIGLRPEETGFTVSKGTVVDATIIAAPASAKNRSKSRDPEMSSTRKGNQWYFGMKAHIGVDAHSDAVRSVTGTSAKVHDITRTDSLVDGREEALFGDRAYCDRKREAGNRRVFYGITDKKPKGRKLSASQQKRDKKLRSVRAKVEHPFQVVQCQWNYRKTRYGGIRKNLDRIGMLFALYNLFKARKYWFDLA